MEIDEKEFPSNSSKVKPTDDIPDDKKKVGKIVKGEVIKKKQSLINRFSESFFGDDADTVGEYILWDVLLPAAKNTISDMITTATDMILYGESRTGRRRDRGRDDRSFVSYSGFYNRDRRDDRRDDRDRRDRNSRNSKYKFDDIIITSRSDAEDVMDLLLEHIDKYGSASVADFYEAVDIVGDYVDDKYGWTNLGTAKIIRVREGFILSLPRPQALD